MATRSALSRRNITGAADAVFLVVAQWSLALEKTKMSQWRVTGIGGFFFRAEQPERLAQWYLQHLGVALVPQSYNSEPWRTDAGVAIFAPFDKGSDYL